jgi:tetratricopeptide (TPR) repeat protein
MSGRDYRTEDQLAAKWLADQVGDWALPGPSIDETEPWMLFAKGEYLRQRGDRQEAQVFFRRSQELDAESPLAAAGIAALNIDQVTRAQSLSIIVQQHPDLVHPRLALAASLTVMKDTRAAAEQLRACTRLLPDDPRPWFGLARLLLTQGDRPGAAEALDHLSALTRKSPGAQRLTAIGFVACGRYGKASRIALAVARGFPGWRNRLFPLLLPLEAEPRSTRLWVVGTIEATLVFATVVLASSQQWASLIPGVLAVLLGLDYVLSRVAVHKDRKERGNGEVSK